MIEAYGGTNIFTTTYNNTTNSFSIGTAYPDKRINILTDYEIKQLMSVVPSVVSWLGPNGNSFDISNLASINYNIRNNKNDYSITYAYGINFTCDFLKLHTINNIYITSPNLGSFDTISNFSNNVIKKVPVTSDYGFMIIDQNMSSNDTFYKITRRACNF